MFQIIWQTLNYPWLRPFSIPIVSPVVLMYKYDPSDSDSPNHFLVSVRVDLLQQMGFEVGMSRCLNICFHGLTPSDCSYRY